VAEACSGMRLMMALPSLIGVIIVTFILTRALPGDPAAYFAGPAATKEAVEQVRAKLGLDRPLPIQFVGYVTDLAQGNFGTSLTTGQPVLTEIRNRLPASAELTLLGLMVSIMVALPLGMLAALAWIGNDHFADRDDGWRFAAGVHRLVAGLFSISAWHCVAPLGRLDGFATRRRPLPAST
jgi:peptide/nickel transport system permease protein